MAGLTLTASRLQLTTSPAAELRSRYILAARSLVGVRYRHRGRSRDEGLDCLGVVLESARLCGFEYVDAEYEFIPEGDQLDRSLGAHMIRLPHWSMALPGDVITRCYRLGQPAKHCGVVLTNLPGNLDLVHAQRRGERRVVKGRWTDPHFNCHAYRAREIAELEA